MNTASSSFYNVLTPLIDRLDSDAAVKAGVIPWSCPVPAFGEVFSPRLATLGINPSNREFVDQSGNELRGKFRRFHTLSSLGLYCWAEADARHLDLVLDTFQSYFSINPYHLWFRKLDFVIGGAKFSYYGGSRDACHLDLVPFATARKWSALSERQRASLLVLSGTTLGTILRDSLIQTIILNGSSVVKAFEFVAGKKLHAEVFSDWVLARTSSRNVKGVAFTGLVDSVSGVKLDRQLQVLGFNHNLQGSFGVTNPVISSIREWIKRTIEEASL